ncbi:MAG: His/Gly/Thr/Pro-type tRNA ligase C-terminal domain-containing protein, partial [Patescibacteria group bacterium]
ATAHNLVQNFSKPCDSHFQNKEGKQDFVWQTSWGLSTRSLGGLFLTHGDDSGLLFPPKIAPIQVVVVPIHKKGDDGKALALYCEDVCEALGRGSVKVKLDDREEPSVGRRFNEWEIKGVPVRLEVGSKELADRSVTIARRDTGEKMTVDREEVLDNIERLLSEMQKALFAKAKAFLDENTREASSFDEFKTIMNSTRGFIRAFWCEDAECETKIKEETKASTRCLPLDDKEEKGVCVHCGKLAIHRWLFAQAY